MAIAPTGPVSTLVADAAQPRPVTAPAPEQPTADQSTQVESPSQAVTAPSTDTGVDSDTPRESRVDISV